ncbi:MAG: hypothetical protein OXN94_12450 [Chloroflexota bacterium]|nr:hypothetical protein [Chloroflexota bacterium]MDE2858644.1 hypothetical protein [Chloroflexota bacterium]MDE2950678.1 hypothetical protein [Chloroflexota bacterium]
MKFRTLLALSFVFMLVMPVMAKNRLPVPNVKWVWFGEFTEQGSRYWCVELGWEPVDGASPPTEEISSWGSPSWSSRAYALRVWTVGNNAPKFADERMYGKQAPYHSKWARIGDDGRRGAVGALDSGRWVFANYCGYAENQTLKIRLRAVQENGRRGQVSKTFRVKLPSFGEAGTPDIRSEMGGGQVVYGKVR